MEENKADRPVRRRQHSQAFKAEVVAACKQSGVSIAAVAMRYQLNANLLRRWLTQQEERDAPASLQAMGGRTW
jgi:transposase-like protein